MRASSIRYLPLTWAFLNSSSGLASGAGAALTAHPASATRPPHSTRPRTYFHFMTCSSLGGGVTPPDRLKPGLQPQTGSRWSPAFRRFGDRPLTRVDGKPPATDDTKSLPHRPPRCNADVTQSLLALTTAKPHHGILNSPSAPRPAPQETAMPSAVRLALPVLLLLAAGAAGAADADLAARA